MYVEDFPSLDEPIDDEEIEAAVLGASSTSKRRLRDGMRDIPIEEARYDGDRRPGKIHRSEGRLLPNWGSAAGNGTSASSSRAVAVGNVETKTVDQAEDGRRWAFLPPSCRQDDSKVKYPAMSFRGRIVYARTHSEVEKASAELMKILRSKKEGMEKTPLGFDIEWRPNFIKGEKPKKSALMQICVDTNHCFVMHIFHSGIPPTLRALLADSSYVKVGISIAGDAAKILKDYSVEVTPLEDLSDFANIKLGAPQKQWGLSSLTEMVACKQLAKPKKIRMGNWEAKELSKEQLRYAATDAFASWFLYEALKSYPEKISGCEDEQCLNVVHIKNTGA